jgi:hypothetical protein
VVSSHRKLPLSKAMVVKVAEGPTIGPFAAHRALTRHAAYHRIGVGLAERIGE